MLFLYRVLINLVFLFSPLIIIFRIIKKKESLTRFKEKIGFFQKKKKSGKLIWFHGASVGELMSIVPILEKYKNNKKISQILVTSNTLSSSKIIEKLNIKKVTHQFFPIDTNIISMKFINYWKPSKVFFIDSEIWPNTILNLKEKKIPIILINGRITKKTFTRWRYFKNFSNQIFSKFDLCLSSSKESFNFLKKLKLRNLKFIGNIKFAQSENENLSMDRKLKKFLKGRKKWCASSTHNFEEKICGLVHLKMKKKFKNLITIIIPRHINRCPEIKNDLEKINLKVHMDSSQKDISLDTDIYLVNSYGKTKMFFNNCKNIFLGGSLIKHGGQNPLEAARYGCNILHGPNVENFKEIYSFLKKIKISTKITSQRDLNKNLNNFLNKKSRVKEIQKKLKKMGQKILKQTYKEINF